MTTLNYVYALYSFAYNVIGLAHQDLIRYSKCEWQDLKMDTNLFHDDICSALATDTKAKQVYGF